MSTMKADDVIMHVRRIMVDNVLIVPPYEFGNSSGWKNELLEIKK
jgi:hypothetical protein